VNDALELAAVSKVYEVGGVEIAALDDVYLTVADEEVVTLLGPSGSGKTTLLSIAGGLLSPSSGQVVVGGRDITHASPRELTAFRRELVGFIFQSVNLVPFLTARENLLVVADLANRDRGEARRRADRLLEELGLAGRRGNLPPQLSGGERQRVAIGRALMNRPALVLVDEPTSALDSDLGQQVMQLIVSEVKARGAAAVIVTHDSRMTRYGDRILNMADGRIAAMTPRPEWTINRPSPQPPPAPVLDPDRRVWRRQVALPDIGELSRRHSRPQPAPQPAPPPHVARRAGSPRVEALRPPPRPDPGPGTARHIWPSGWWGRGN
jgi:putative ABC transport system ATP-binding protein